MTNGDSRLSPFANRTRAKSRRQAPCTGTLSCSGPAEARPCMALEDGEISLLGFKLNRSAAALKPVPVAPPPAVPAEPVQITVESLGQQLREVLPTRRLHSVCVCDHEANVLWLSEGALGPDEHGLVVEALEVLATDTVLNI